MLTELDPCLAEIRIILTEHALEKFGRCLGGAARTIDLQSALIKKVRRSHFFRADVRGTWVYVFADWSFVLSPWNDELDCALIVVTCWRRQPKIWPRIKPKAFLKRAKEKREWRKRIAGGTQIEE